MDYFIIDDWHDKSDEDLLKASYEKPELFELLVLRHEAAFLRKARRILHNEELSRDVVQDTFVKIYLYGRKFRPIEGAKFTSWAYRVLINVCFLYYKKNKKERELFSTLDDGMEDYIPHDDTDESKQKLDRDYLESMFSKIPETFARVLRLYVVEGKNYAEIAEKEGVTEGAIKTRMHRARSMMKELSKKIEY